MAERTLADLLADAKRDPQPDEDARSAWLDLLAGTTGAVNRLQRKLKGKKKSDEAAPVAIGIRG